MAPGGATPFRELEAEFFRALNALVEPAVRAGCGSPGLLPTGLVVLETTGASGGRPRRVPLLATVLDGCVFVSTIRGPRSRWVDDLRAHPDVRYWLGGRPHRGRALVLDRDADRARLDRLPPLARSIAQGLLAPATSMGWAFAVIAPAIEAGP
jgi:F420H(2)-dependent quinone reductase